MQRSECDFMEMLYCGGKAWVVVLHADFFFPSPRFLLRAAGRRSGAVAACAVRCGAHGGLKVA